jgi:ATP-binding cassette subfamily F protein 3
MLTLTGVSKSYGDRTLFADAALQVNRGDRIGLVGPNGAGKSTLFGLILGEEPPDDGQIHQEKGSSIGYLPQESQPLGDESAFEIAVAITPDFLKVRQQVLAWDHAHPDEAAHRDDLHDDAHERFRELNGYQVEAKARSMLGGLGFRDRDMDRPARELSGGWVMRAHLARLLTQEPDLLMLDEPTNHLDLQSLLWFQDYLRGYPGAILVISHDREFLNHLVTGIVEIRQQKLVRYSGNYNKYVAQREANDAQLLAAYKTQQKEIAHLQAFADRFKAKASKATQAQSKLKAIERMEKIEAPVADGKRVGFRFPQPPRSGQRVLTMEGVHFAYGETKVYQGIDLEVERGERIVLVGPNGAGKSTLLKLLAGRLEPQQGKVILGHNAKSGYFSQYRVDQLQPKRTVLEEACATDPRIPELSVRSVLGSFLYTGNSVDKRIEVLSGGEKSRLALVKLLLDPPNLLLMDEPTTHLDIGSIDALVEALKQFEGTLVFISHDVYFIRALAQKVIHVADGVLTHYPGDYDLYLHKTKADSARAALTQGGKAAVKEEQKAKPQQLEREKKKAQDAQRRTLQRTVQKCEEETARLEARQKELDVLLGDPAVWQDGPRASALGQELTAAKRRLAELASQWEAAMLALEELGGAG